MATRTARSVDRTVDKMLRKMAKSSKAAAGSSASSSTAAQALEQMAQIQKRISRGDTDAAQFLIEKATASQELTDDSSVDALRQSMREARKRKASTQAADSSKQRLFIGAGAALASLLAVVFAVGGFGSAGHSVRGTIYVDQHTAADLDIIFHSVSQSDVRVKLRTSADGSFLVESLPPGDYKIILLPTDGVHAIPKRYSSPISTPLRLKLHEDTSDLTMNVASEPKMSQG
jgi:hypothetical protein